MPLQLKTSFFPSKKKITYLFTQRKCTMSRMKDKTFISVLVMTDVISTYTHFQKLGNGDDAEKWNHEIMFVN